MSDIASFVLTAVLVGITGYYAWQNKRMVEEMKATRAVQVLPKLALQWYRPGPMMGFVRLINVGPGPALDVDVTVIFQPPSGSSTVVDRRSLRLSLMAPGEFEDLFPGPHGHLMDMPALVSTYERIVLEGECSDAAGGFHLIADSLEDLAAWRESQKEARLRWEDPNAEKRLADALDKKFASSLKEIASESARLRRLLESRFPPPDEAVG